MVAVERNKHLGRMPFEYTSQYSYNITLLQILVQSILQINPSEFRLLLYIF